MATVAPFRAVRANPELVAHIAAPPYDVVSLEEARNMARENQYSFLRVSRAELELNGKIDPYSPDVYKKGADNLRNLIKDGILIQEEQPLLGVYRQVAGTHEQTGLVALASVDEYDRGIIKQHELTRPEKEMDRFQLIEAHGSQSGLVLLFFRRMAKFKYWLDAVTCTPPDSHFVTDDNVEHTIWSIRDQSAIHQITEDFREIKTLYIADGHHRSAAASRVKALHSKSNTMASNRHEEGFLAVIFPHDELQILPYNRVVRDLNGMTPNQFIELLATHFELQLVTEAGNPPPAGFDIYVQGRWHRAKPKLIQGQSSEIGNDPVRSLAVSVLTEQVLGPLLGIFEASDPRIDFIGGNCYSEKLEAMVDRGDWAVAFWLHPTTVTEIMSVADAKGIMPPKSTWFEPKLRDGLFVHMIRDE